MTPTFRQLRTGEEDAVAAMLARAFAAEPFLDWVTGGAQDLERRAAFLRLAIRHLAVPHGIALVEDGLRAALLLVAPGAMPLPARANAAMLPSLIGATGLRRAPLVLRGLAHLEGAHPDEPHWTALVLGVSPGYQRRGFATALMAHAQPLLGGRPVYLETAEPATAALYARAGFKPLRTLALPGGGPAMHTMWRPAEAARMAA